MKGNRFLSALLAVFWVSFSPELLAQAGMVGWVPMDPAPVKSHDDHYLVYEIQFTNYYPMEQVLQSVEVRADSADGILLEKYQGEELAGNIMDPGRSTDPETMTTMGAGGSRLVYFFVNVPAGRELPGKLHHKVTLSVKLPEDKTRENILNMTVDVKPVQEVAVIGPPLKGGLWTSLNGLSNTAGHRRTPIPQDGRTDFAQRYAIDYIIVDEKGSAVPPGTDLSVNENHYAWGKEVIAVADGVVTSVLKGIPDHKQAGKMDEDWTTTLENATGNHVIVDIGNGHYATFSHLKNGSVTVDLGDRVKKGQVLGLVGNTGNSTGPHLHFHVIDRGESVLAAEGIPYVHPQFNTLANCQINMEKTEAEEDLYLDCTDMGKVKRHKNEMPLLGDVIRF